MSKNDQQTDEISWEGIANSDEQSVYSSRLMTQKMRAEIIKLINAVAEQAITKPLRQSNLVCFMILMRVKEVMLSIESLSIKGLVQDAAIAVQTLIKLRLDLQYIAENNKQAEEWIQTKRKYQRPWRVKFLIDQLFVDADVKKKEKNNYRYYSKLKHLNPMENQPDFPIKPIETKDVDHEFNIKQKETDPNIVVSFLLREGKECNKSFNAALKDFTDAGFDVKDHASSMKKIYKLFNSIYSLKKEINKNKEDPDI